MLSYTVAVTFGGSAWNVSVGFDFCGGPLWVSFGFPWGESRGRIHWGGLPTPLGILDSGGPLGGSSGDLVVDPMGYTYKGIPHGVSWGMLGCGAVPAVP